MGFAGSNCAHQVWVKEWKPWGRHGCRVDRRLRGEEGEGAMTRGATRQGSRSGEKREMNDERISFSRGQVGVTAGNVTWAVSNPRGR